VVTASTCIVVESVDEASHPWYFAADIDVVRSELDALRHNEVGVLLKRSCCCNDNFRCLHEHGNRRLVVCVRDKYRYLRAGESGVEVEGAPKPLSATHTSSPHPIVLRSSTSFAASLPAMPHL
jgi:hypothetical protein